MIRNDLHVHSVQSADGIHTLFEIGEIMLKKGIRMVNISDHGSQADRNMIFGVFVNKKRIPDPLVLPSGKSVRILRGIEANIVNEDGLTDIPEKTAHLFDLISIGFHSCGLFEKGMQESYYTAILERCLRTNKIDILTHPCISSFPLNIRAVVELALEYGFALEINNINLATQKNKCRQAERDDPPRLAL